MKTLVLVACLLTLLLTDLRTCCAADAEGEKLSAPILRVAADGPLAYVSSLAFREDKLDQKLVLHAAGWDKTVHSWNLPNGRDKWQYDRSGSLRVPIGPASFGSANAMAISADGEWLAVGGQSLVKGLSEEKDDGCLWPIVGISTDVSLDLGTIFVFHLPTGKVQRFRGHAGTVLSLTFVPGPDPVLISAAVERDHGVVTDGKLRAWDIRGNRGLNVLNQLPKRIARPGLVGWRTGDNLNDVRVGIAWSDVNPTTDKLRVWDVATNELSEESGGTYCASVCLLPGSTPRLLTGAAEKLGIWTTTPQLIQPKYRELVKFPPINRNQQIPVAVIGIPSQAPDGDLAATILANTEKDPYRLVFASVATGKIVSQFPLWQGESKPPVLAIDTRGQHLAVSGNEDNEVWIFRMRDILEHKNIQPVEKQILHSTSLSTRFAAFVKQNNRLGLVVRKEVPAASAAKRDQQPGDRVFDFIQRRFTQGQGWGDFGADFSNWQVKASKVSGKLKLDVSIGNERMKGIELDDRDRLETWAGCSASKVFDEPLLAMGITHDDGESQLWLFNAKSGARLRRLSGHMDRITSVSFSQDGRFLVSTSLDRTVRIWWLSDLKDSLNAHGGLSGLEVSTNSDEQLVVQSDIPGRFLSGDQLAIADAAQPQKLQTFKTATDFYRYVSERKPGDRILADVTHRVGEKPTRTELTVQQCIDERKPLCSICLFAERPSDPPSWMAWDPLGRYDSSLAESEGRLGWHFNTDEAGSPVRFAPAEKYRDQNYWEGLAADHLEQGPELIRRPRPEPQTSMFLREGTRLLNSAPDEPFLVRTEPVSAFLRITAFPERLIQQVTCSLDGKACEFAKVAEGLWQANLEPLRETRDISRVVASITTVEYPPRTFSSEVSLRRIPAPPTITVNPQIPKSVDDKMLDFSVAVQSGVFKNSESVSLKLSHLHEGREVAMQNWNAEDTKPSNQHVQLRMGENVLTVMARHSGSLPEQQKLEESRQTFVVRLTEPRRPVIQKLGIVPNDEKTPVAIDPDSPWVTERPSIEVRGRIAVESPDVLSRASYSISDEPDVELAGFKIGPMFEISQTVPIRKAGQQTITLSTLSNREVTDRVSFNVNFKPALPDFKQLGITTKGLALPNNNVLIQGRDDREITAEAVFVAPPKDMLFPHEVEVLLRLKSREPTLERLVKFPAGNPTPIREVFQLQPGKNELQLIIRNQWTEKLLVTERLSYRQPPQIIKVELPSESKTSEVEMVAEIASPTRPTRIQMLSNGFEVPLEKIMLQKGSGNNWKVTSPISLDLDGKRTTVDLAVENADGECLKRYHGEVTYIKPPPPIPEIRAGFPQSIRTQDPVLKVPFRIRSETPLEQISIMMDRGTVRCLDIPLDKLPQADAEGFISTSYEWSIDELEEPTFKFAIHAKNASGTVRSAAAEVNFLMKPLELVIDELRPAGGSPLKRTGFKTQRFEPADAARLELNGHLNGKNFVKARVKIWVNGFLQTSVPVQPNGVFTGKIALNLKDSNRISFEVPNLSIDELQIPKLVIDCKAHQQPATLRLVTVIAADQRRKQDSAGVDQKLQERILSAMRVRNPAVGNFQVGPGVLIDGDFTEDQLIGVLVNMGLVMRRPGGEPANDILVLYYQGSEVHRGDADFELTTGNPRITVKRRTLVNLLGDMPGAHLLLLDVERAPPEAGEKAWSDPHLGMMRVAWLDQPKVNADPFRLVDALEKSMGKSNPSQKRLTLLASEMHEVYKAFHKRFPHMLFDYEIPSELEELVVTP